jgi:two-component system phosphate regulon sensor histidine kinase PhoR
MVPVGSRHLAPWGLAAAGVGLAALASFGVITPLPAAILSAGLLLGGAAMATKTAQEHEEIESQAEATVEALENQLERQRNALAILTDGLQIAIFTCDLRPVIVHANRSAIAMFNFEDPVGRTVLAVTLSYELEQLLLEVLHTSEPVRRELTIGYPQERVVIADAWLEPGAERVFLSLYEITGLRHLERVRTDFVANVSHELRTPLTTIRAMAETLSEEHEDDALRDRFLGKIVSEVDRLSLIAEDLLVLSAAESNPVRKQACDLGDILTSVIQQLRRKAKDKGLELAFHGPNHLLIEANPAQISQVAINLIDNAINYTSEGRVDVHLRHTESTASFTVEDTGLGIPSDQINRIFERFYRVDKGRSRATGGTGLGLSIVKHITEAHGGKVTVVSNLNQGSAFTVELPIGTPTSPREA